MAIACASSIDHVTIYARGAVVTRQIRLPEALPDGVVELEINGVTALAEPGSLRLSLEGSRAALSVRALPVDPPVEGLGQLPEKVRELRHRIDRLKGEIQALEDRRGRLVRLHPDAWPGAVTGVDARTKQALGLGKMLDDLLTRLDARWFELEESLREATERLSAMELSLSQSSSSRGDFGSPTRKLLAQIGGAGKLTRAEVSYVVAPARWWPLYTLRVADKSASLTVEALVAQLSGEDWSAARLSFAAADLVHDARLPDLPSLRLGRAQPAARRGYRPPPPGLDQLFAAHDRYFPDLIPPRPIPDDDPEINYTLRDILVGGALTEGGGKRKEEAKERLKKEDPKERLKSGNVEHELDLLDEEEETEKKAPRREQARPDGAVERRRAPPPPPPSLRASLAAPPGPPPSARASAPPPKSGRPPEEPGTTGTPPEQFLDFSRLRLGTAGDRQRRGRLLLVIDDARSLAAMRRIEATAPPVSDLRDPRQSRGNFAHRYDAAARGSIPSDGVAHLVPVLSAEAPLRMSFRSIPRETAEVYREAQMANPFDAPLLAGPMQIYVDHSLLASTQIERVGKGGTVRAGLGVEPRIKIARNVQTQEGASGLLNGSTVVSQTVRIDVASSLGFPAEIELLDLAPISEDKQILVERTGSNPEARPYDQAERGEPVRGGLRWLLTIPPAGSARVEHSFRITLPAKFELTGGNRRD